MKIRQQTQKGFTLVEMLVVAPIVILAIGAFLTAIIGMTGEVLASRASNDLSFNVQDALNRIEQDVKLSNSFLATNSVIGANQGYNDDATGFTSIGGASGTSLILSMVATTGNPTATSSTYVFLKNKPNDCTAPQNNIPFTYNVVYFVKDNTLFRRTLMPANYNDTTNTVCSIPWQQPSCSPTFMDSPTGGQTGSAFCKTKDIELVDGIGSGGFSIQYFNGESATSVNAPASTTLVDADRAIALQPATTVGIAITAQKTAAGRDIERSAILKVSRLDTNASSIATLTTDGTPIAATVTAQMSEPTNVVFSWPTVPTATGYTFEYQVNAGAWTTGFTNQTTRTFTVTNATHRDVVNARVTSINSAGNSGYGTAGITIPLWTPFTLDNTWVDFGPPFASAAYTKTSTGLVVLKGMVRAGTYTIGTLPVGYRPAAWIMFQNSSNSAGGRLDVASDGTVNMSVGSNAWVSLDGVAFMPSGSTFTAATLVNSWLNYSPGSGDARWQTAGFLTDSIGRVVTTGLIRNGTTTTGTTMFNLPAGSRPSAYMHILNDVGNASTHFSIDSSGNVLAKGFGNNYLSLQTIFYPSSRAVGSTCTTQWCSLSYVNSWQNYSTPLYTAGQYTKSSDGLVMLRGLLSNPGSPTRTIATLPVGYCPAETSLQGVSSNGVWARLDVIRNSDGTCYLLPGTGASNVWLSLDSVRYMAE